MNATQLSKLARRYFLAEFPGYVYGARLLYAQPVRDLIRGFYLEPTSADPAAMYVWCFVQPLYIPADHIIFTFGFRIHELDKPGRARWIIASQNESEKIGELVRQMKSQGLPYLAQLATPADIAEKLLDVRPNVDPLFAAEAIAFSYAAAGQHEAAVSALRQLEKMLKETMVQPNESITKLLERSTELLNCLEQGPTETRSLLDRWIAATKLALRVESCRRS